jgi:pSer/pThr/pTyr-binding forkhead associated (FHA) protein
MQVKLHLVKGNPPGKQVEVLPGTLTIGRAEDSGLIIASTRVSRHHCEIVNEQNRIIIRDKGSGNGTIVNGAKVTEQPLGPGDEVAIGPLTFQVEINGNRQRKAPPATAFKPAAPKPAAPKRSFGKAGPADILSSLENLAGKKPGPQAPKDDDVLQISDDDLLENP